MSDCRKFESQIALDVSGDLSHQKSILLRGHLAECDACRQYAEEMRDQRRLLRTLRQDENEFDDTLLTGLRHSVMTRVGAQSGMVFSWRRLFQRFDWRYATVAIAILIITLSGLSFFWHPSSIRKQGVSPPQVSGMNPIPDALVDKKNGMNKLNSLKPGGPMRAAIAHKNNLPRRRVPTNGNPNSMRTPGTSGMAQGNMESSTANLTEEFKPSPVVAQQEKTRLEIHTQDANVRIIWLLNIESKPLVSKKG